MKRRSRVVGVLFSPELLLIGLDRVTFLANRLLFNHHLMEREVST